MTDENAQLIEIVKANPGLTSGGVLRKYVEKHGDISGLHQKLQRLKRRGLLMSTDNKTSLPTWTVIEK